jgi:hypothetical protein
METKMSFKNLLLVLVLIVFTTSFAFASDPDPAVTHGSWSWNHTDDYVWYAGFETYEIDASVPSYATVDGELSVTWDTAWDEDDLAEEFVQIVVGGAYSSICVCYEDYVKFNSSYSTDDSHAAAGSWSGPIGSKNYTIDGISITTPFLETWSGSFDFIWGAETPVGD